MQSRDVLQGDGAWEPKREHKQQSRKQSGADKEKRKASRKVARQTGGKAAEAEESDDDDGGSGSSDSDDSGSTVGASRRGPPAVKSGSKGSGAAASAGARSGATVSDDCSRERGATASVRLAKHPGHLENQGPVATSPGAQAQSLRHGHSTMGDVMPKRKFLRAVSALTVHPPSIATVRVAHR